MPSSPLTLDAWYAARLSQPASPVAAAAGLSPVCPVFDPDRPFRVDVPEGIGAAEAARWRAAGLLRRLVLDVHVATDVEDRPGVRAGALACLLPERLADAVLAGRSAYWVHVGGTAPERVDVVLPPGRHSADAPGVRVRQAELAEDDVDVVEGTPVTSPVRTAVDLARCPHAPAAVEELRLLAAATGCTAADALRRLEPMTGRRGVSAARRLITAWLGSDPQSSPRRPTTR